MAGDRSGSRWGSRETYELVQAITEVVKGVKEAVAGQTADSNQVLQRALTSLW